MASGVIMINLFGAVALLLFGLSQVKEGVSRAFGPRLRERLETGTRGGFRSFSSGFIATVALQSSTATALMIASFVERELVAPRAAQIVLLGANVGTAVTAWIVATGVAWLSPLLILVGIILYRSGSGPRQGGGTALIGIGLMLLSLHLLSGATAPMLSSPALKVFIALLDNAWPVALLFSAGLALLSSSSLAVVILIVSLASTGALGGGLTVALVLGANLGGAVTPVLATLKAPPSVRRVTLGNLLIRTAGCLIALPFAGMIAGLLETIPFLPSTLPVDIHLFFNIVLALLAWPLSDRISTLMHGFIPDVATTEEGPRFLDPEEIKTPVVALASATREVLGVGDLTERMLMRVADAFEYNDMIKLQDVPQLEKRVDALQQAVKLYLSKLGSTGLEGDNASRATVILDYVINLEHASDIIEKGLYEQVKKKITLGLHLSDDGFQELRKFLNLTIDNLRIAQTIFVTGDFNLARQLMEVKIKVRRLEKQSSEDHLKRLREGRVESLQTSSLHLDMLRDLKRVNAHIVSVAHPILDKGGLLGESRLRDAAAH